MTTSKEVAMFGNPGAMPSYIAKEKTNLGNEQVDENDVRVAQIKLLQGLSPEVADDKGKAGEFYHTGIEATMKEVYCTNLRLTTSYAIWKKRDEGGGLHAEFDSLEDAREEMKTLPAGGSSFDIMVSHKHDLVLMEPTEDGSFTAKSHVVYFASKPVDGKTTSGYIASQNWNQKIIEVGGGEAPRCAGVWKLAAKKVTNKSNQSYFVSEISHYGWLPKDLFTKAMDTTKALMNGTSEEAAA